MDDKTLSAVSTPIRDLRDEVCDIQERPDAGEHQRRGRPMGVIPDLMFTPSRIAKNSSRVCTTIDDLKDEVWCRVYAADFMGEPVPSTEITAGAAGVRAGLSADWAVKYMPIPAHRKPGGT